MASLGPLNAKMLAENNAKSAIMYGALEYTFRPFERKVVEFLERLSAFVASVVIFAGCFFLGL